MRQILYPSNARDSSRVETTQLVCINCINMAGSAIVDIRPTFGAIFVGLLFSTTSVLLFSIFAGLF
jgi:hypothetical protein